MGTASLSRRARDRVLSLALGLIVSVGVAAQTPAPSPAATAPTAKPAQPAKPAKKAAKKSATEDFKLVLEPRAMDLLRAMSAKIAAAKAMSFTAIVGYEYPSRLGPPIVYTTRYDVTMRRPDKLKIVMPGDGPASEFYYDGKAMMAYSPVENLVAVADAPPTIEGALDTAYKTAAIYYPFTDLLVADPYAALTEGVILAFYIGPSGVVGGTKTDMLAWANNDVFLQIWIGTEDKLPRRVRAVFSDDPLRLRHEMELTNWQLDPVIAGDVFASQKALAANRMAFANPSPPAPKGIKPIVKGMTDKAASPKPQPKSQ